MNGKAKGWGFAILLCGIMMLSGCASRKKIIKSQGLSFVKLGDDMPAAGIGRLKGIAVKDTLFEEDEYAWRATALQYRNGTVFVEEDFWRSEMVSRIQVRTPDLRLKNGLKVGKQVKDLMTIGGEWFIAPMPRFNRYDVYSRFFPRIHFVVADPKKAMPDMEWRGFDLKELDPEAVIEMIVVY